ncbi:hypothetical protein BKA65DRAFT_486379 [Rhexocercosporidium sp. MPI-PUGE-AT-0058]|nr:hypothetical protein BKA65DRAFT_486379 [Rhexocercosporidium sp. MPI-PUGE-AT-0058]
MASTLLRRGLPDEAEEMLRKCPLIKDFSDKDFLDSKNPRFSGDTLLELVSITQNRVNAAGYYTHALFKLSEVRNDIDKLHIRRVGSGGHQIIASPKSIEYRDKAIKSLGSLINNKFLLYDESEYDYGKLTP